MATIAGKRGDPRLLKVVLLKEILDSTRNLRVILEGEDFYLKPDEEETITSANRACQWICKEEAKLSENLCSHSELSDKWLQWENEKLKAAVSIAHREDVLPDELKVCLQYLEDHFCDTRSQYLCGEELSLPDVIVWATLYRLTASQTNALQSPYPSVYQWYSKLHQRKDFSNATETMSVDSEDQEKLEKAKMYWEKGHEKIPKPIKLEHPILPEPGERNIMITSALPYVNNVPHLGNIIGCVLSGDVFARYCRLRNYRTIYICGTDEYGTATETKALEENTTPQEICQKYYEVQKSIYEWFGIDFEYFGRTSTPQQTEIAQDIFTRLNERGFICKDTVDQLLCEKCDMFLADRFVEGNCPLCDYEDARGDQCDKCGKLINATELKNPRCKMCSSQPIVKASKHLFLDLPKLQTEVTTWSKQSCKEGIWTANAEQITSSWLRDGLQNRCITRDLKWGTPVPLEGYEDKVFYVWFDAPIGYLSITACYTEQWEKWWKNPSDVQLYQFMAKDNVPFHTVVFPCSLIGAQDNYTLLNNISSTEYLNYEDGKFSKSRGVGVFGNDAKDTNIPADVFRFYLLYIRPETHDSAFSWADFVLKTNTELLNNLGNFINRVLVFAKNKFNGIVPEVSLSKEDLQFVADVNEVLANYLQCLENIKLRDGLKQVLAMSRLGNGYLQDNKPWDLVKGSDCEKIRAGSVIGLSANVVCLLSIMVQPYMPEVSRKIQEQLQAPQDCNVLPDAMIQVLRPGHKIGLPVPLFNKIEDSVAKKLKEKFSGQQRSGMTRSSEKDLSLEKELDKQTSLVEELNSKYQMMKDELNAETKKLQSLQRKVEAAKK